MDVKRRNGSLALITALFAISFVSPSAADEKTNNFEPATKFYAREYGVSLEEADRREKKTNKARPLQARLKREMPDTFGGMYLEHTPKHRMIVLFTGDAAAQLARFTKDPFFVAKRALHALELLVAVQREASEILHENSIGYMVSLDVEAGEILIAADDVPKASRLLHRLRSIYGFIRIERGGNPEPVELLGGQEVTGISPSGYRVSTLGFNVVDSMRELHITGAGHAVDNAVFVDGQPSNLIYRDQRYGGDYDFQWFSQNQSSQPAPQLNEIFTFDLEDPVLEITSTLDVDQLVLGELICKSGRTTFNTCGKLVDHASATNNNGFQGFFPLVAPSRIGDAMVAGETAAAPSSTVALQLALCSQAPIDMTSGSAGCSSCRSNACPPWASPSLQNLLHSLQFLT